MKKNIFIFFLLILFVILISISLHYFIKSSKFYILDVSKDRLNHPIVFSNILNNTIETLPNNNMRVLITVPHSQSHSKHDNLKWHTNDFAAVTAMNYLKYFLEQKNITVHYILSKQNRFSLSDNFINNGIDDNRVEGCIGKKIVSDNYERYLNCNNSTPLWKNMIYQLKTFKPNFIIDCHSFPEHIKKSWKYNLEIFMPKNQSKKVKQFLVNNISLLNNHNIGVVKIIPTNYVNAITEFCNQQNLNSALFEFKELSDDQIKKTCYNIVSLLYNILFPTLK